MNKRLSLILIFFSIVFGTIYIVQRHRDVQYTFNDIEEVNVADSAQLFKDDDVLIVSIEGEVLNPDLYILRKGAKLKDAIKVAGGLTENADKLNLDMEKELKNKDKIVILSKSTDKIDASVQNTKLININTADKQTLKELPKIGDVIAENIIKYREDYGSFKNIEEIKNVKMIGEKIFEQIKDLITI